MRANERAQRKVNVKLPELVIDRRDWVFNVKDVDGSKIGDLKISQGGIVWKGHGQVWRSTIPWSTFDSVMRDYYGQRRFTRRT